jgi:hypothetical protein
MDEKQETGIMEVNVVDESIACLTPKQIGLIKIKTPAGYVKKRKGKGGREFDYIETNYVITMLNSLFGFRWDLDVLWEVPFEEALKQGSVTVKTKLTVYDKNGNALSKTQYGSQPIVYEKDKPREVQYLAMEVGDLYKSATSDGLKKCASLFGIALDVYSGEFSDKEEFQSGPAAKYVKPVYSGGDGKPPTDDGTYRLSVKQQKMVQAIGWNIQVKPNEIKDLANALFGINSMSIFPTRERFDDFLETLRTFKNKDEFMLYLKSAQSNGEAPSAEQGV